MTRPDPYNDPQGLDYARPRQPADEMQPPGPQWAARRSRFRTFWLITRIVYLVICLAIFAFIWKYIQGYITLLDTAGN